ncbi:unnamed protein product [Moneuplotes crassus]|uniref:Uncharacterized protein n=1 Tax=Euplotes crassus TaxID=5936 RepID=A0AAD1UEJ2_EUPCR|nr:unnamed protein product [Moneuplotes crassus]
MSNRNGKSTEIKKYYTHKITKSKNETQDVNRVITKLAISGSQSPSEPRKQTSVFMKYLIKPNHKHKVLSNKCMALRKTIQNSITPSHMPLNQTRQSHRVKRWESLNKTRQTPRIPQISSSTEVKILPPSSKRGTRQNTQTQKLQNIYIIPRVP